MRSTHLFKAQALACAGLLLAATTAAATDAPSADDTARILAGLAPASQSPLAPLTQERTWQNHAKVFDTAWKRLDDGQLSKIRAWSAKELPARRPVMFYMFSGPDYLYADTFFPNATTYVLSGLEPVGPLPDLANLPKGGLGPELRQLEGSLNSVLNFSFFITKKMKTQLAGGRISGTLPILYVFLARSGKTIRDVSLVTLEADGTVKPAEAALTKGASRGAKITFSGSEGREQTLYYFTTDLSDGGLKTSGFLKFCEGLGTGDSLVKSASYLMHSDAFAAIRGFLIEHSAVLVQDDSGIPVRYLDRTAWDLTAFGTYLGPLSIFPGRSQPMMRELFRKGLAKPLDFGIGYRWRPRESNLLLAVKKGAQSAAGGN